MHCEEIENNGMWERVLHKPEGEGKREHASRPFVCSEKIALLATAAQHMMYNRKSLILNFIQIFTYLIYS